MNPEEVREVLRCQAHSLPVPPMADADADTAEAIFASISASYFRLRRGLAILALALPVLLWLGTGATLEPSISAYYHAGPATLRYGAGPMRDVFVGVLWALGVFLYFYKGYSRAENIALDIAGAAAVGVALFPMDWPPDSGRTPVGAAHYTCAAIFFLAIAYVCIFRSGDTLVLLQDEARRARLKRSYTALGVLMVAAPAGVIAIHLLAPAPERSLTVLFVEVAGIIVFASFWLLKSRELALIEGQPRRVVP